MTSPDLDRYFAACAKKGLNPFYDRLAPHLPAADRGWVLEAGCGLGHGAEWLLDRGHRVEALDPHPQAIQDARKRLARFPEQQYRIRQVALENASFGHYSAIVGVFSFFFVPPDKLQQTWLKLTEALEVGGILAGQLLGPEDDWANALAIVDGEDLRSWLSPFEVIVHDEVNADGKTITDESKHWHIHHLILRKR